MGFAPLSLYLFDNWIFSTWTHLYEISFHSVGKTRYNCENIGRYREKNIISLLRRIVAFMRNPLNNSNFLYKLDRNLRRSPQNCFLELYSYLIQLIPFTKIFPHCFQPYEPSERKNSLFKRKSFMDFNLQYRNIAFYEPFAEAGSSNVNRILREIFEQRLGERRKRERKKKNWLSPRYSSIHNSVLLRAKSKKSRFGCVIRQSVAEWLKFLWVLSRHTR